MLLLALDGVYLMTEFIRLVDICIFDSSPLYCSHNFLHLNCISVLYVPFYFAPFTISVFLFPHLLNNVWLFFAVYCVSYLLSCLLPDAYFLTFLFSIALVINVLFPHLISVSFPLMNSSCIQP